MACGCGHVPHSRGWHGSVGWRPPCPPALPHHPAVLCQTLHDVVLVVVPAKGKVAAEVQEMSNWGSRGTNMTAAHRPLAGLPKLPSVLQLHQSSSAHRRPAQRRPAQPMAAHRRPAHLIDHSASHRLWPGLRRKARMGMSLVDRIWKWPGAGSASGRVQTERETVNRTSSAAVLHSRGQRCDRGQQQANTMRCPCPPLHGTGHATLTHGLQPRPEVVVDAVQVVELAPEAVLAQPNEVVVWWRGRMATAEVHSS